jgi:hypothetical protein
MNGIKIMKSLKNIYFTLFYLRVKHRTCYIRCSKMHAHHEFAEYSLIILRTHNCKLMNKTGNICHIFAKILF